MSRKILIFSSTKFVFLHKRKDKSIFDFILTFFTKTA
jgi:hypothetical protein